MSAAHPDRSTRHLAIARVLTAYLWRHSQPSCISAEDAAVMDILIHLVDKDYDLEALLADVECLVSRSKGLEK